MAARALVIARDQAEAAKRAAAVHRAEEAQRAEAKRAEAWAEAKRAEAAQRAETKRVAEATRQRLALKKQEAQRQAAREATAKRVAAAAHRQAEQRAHALHVERLRAQALHEQALQMNTLREQQRRADELAQHARDAQELAAQAQSEAHNARRNAMAAVRAAGGGGYMSAQEQAATLVESRGAGPRFASSPFDESIMYHHPVPYHAPPLAASRPPPQPDEFYAPPGEENYALGSSLKASAPAYGTLKATAPVFVTAPGGTEGAAAVAATEPWPRHAESRVRQFTGGNAPPAAGGDFGLPAPGPGSSLKATAPAFGELSAAALPFRVEEQAEYYGAGM